MAYALSIFSTKVKIASSSCGWESSTLKKKTITRNVQKLILRPYLPRCVVRPQHPWPDPHWRNRPHGQQQCITGQHLRTPSTKTAILEPCRVPLHPLPVLQQAAIH